MGRGACSSTTDGLTRGAWTAFEDQILTDYIKIHGEGRWSRVSKETGLKRHGKSCRLRWLNYLRPEIKRGNISLEEEDLIIRLHRLLGNRWSLIAGRLPGRTDNEIKNYWNSTLKKKVKPEKSAKELKSKKKPMEEEEHVKSSIKVAVLEPSICEEGLGKNIPSESEYSGDGLLPISTSGNDNSWDFITDLYVDQVSLSGTIHSDYSKLCEFNNNIMFVEECKNGCKNDPLSSSSEQPLFFEEMLKYWAGDENFH